MPKYDLNHDTNTGLLSLPRHWSLRAYRRIAAEIASHGYEVAPHDRFYATIDGRAYYLLTREKEPRDTSSIRAAADREDAAAARIALADGDVALVC